MKLGRDEDGSRVGKGCVHTSPGKSSSEYLFLGAIFVFPLPNNYSFFV